MLHYSWPGNLRELRNAIERSVIFAAGPTLGLADLPSRVATTTEGTGPGNASPIEVGHPVSLDQLETEHIRLILRRSPTLDDASRILGIDPSTLYRKRKQLGL
jgi:NtrC-family two-component system response regulator AlgB